MDSTACHVHGWDQGSGGRNKSQSWKHNRSAKEDVSEYEASEQSATKSQEWDTAVEVARSLQKGKEPATLSGPRKKNLSSKRKKIGV